MGKQNVLQPCGENFWGNRVYKLKDEEKYYADLGNEEHHDIYALSPSNDRDGEPNFPINQGNFIIQLIPKDSQKTRGEQKFTLAKMIAANEYKDGETTVEWIDLASGIKNLELTKELLEELKEHPMELIFDSGIGWIEKEQMEAMVVLKQYGLDSNDNKFRYKMLSRIESDCQYYLEFENNSANCLWAKNENDQIEIMKALYKSFYEWEKPDWITMEQIKEYEMKMLNTKMDT